MRSSPKANVGDPGAVGVEPEGRLETGGVAMFSEVARCDDVGNLGPGCWRMRRRPEAPRPCSCSGRIGDLVMMRQPLLINRTALLYPTQRPAPANAKLTLPCGPAAQRQCSTALRCSRVEGPPIGRPASSRCSASCPAVRHSRGKTASLRGNRSGGLLEESLEG